MGPCGPVVADCCRVRQPLPRLSSCRMPTRRSSCSPSIRGGWKGTRSPLGPNREPQQVCDADFQTCLLCPAAAPLFLLHHPGYEAPRMPEDVVKWRAGSDTVPALDCDPHGVARNDGARPSSGGRARDPWERDGPRRLQRSDQPLFHASRAAEGVSLTTIAGRRHWRRAKQRWLLPVSGMTRKRPVRS